MSVWLAIPSARPIAEAEQVLVKWIERGYKVHLWRDPAVNLMTEIDWAKRLGMTITWSEYPGYARAVNALCKSILERDPEAKWIVTGGDDVEPDPNKTAEEIAAECASYFARLHAGPDAEPGVDLSTKSIRAALKGLADHTFGVMQPTGDPWRDVQGRIIDRIAGSPWMGREFCRRMNGGAGPLWPEYTHCFEDEELQLVAHKLGVFWQRSDLTHLHNHWARQEKPRKIVKPDHLAEATSPEHWAKFKALFEQRRAAGFPGHEPIV